MAKLTDGPGESAAGPRVGAWHGAGDGEAARYLADLVPALVRADASATVRLLSAGGAALPDAVRSAGNGRVTVATRRDQVRDALRPGALAQGWVAASNSLVAGVDVARAFRRGTAGKLLRPVKKLLKWAAGRGRRGGPLAALAFALGLPAVFLIAWAGFAVSRLVWSLTRGAFFPLRVVDLLVRHCRPKLSRADGCDVWVLPLGKRDAPLRQPAVYLVDGLDAAEAKAAASRLETRRNAVIPGGPRPIPCVVGGSLGNRPERLYGPDVAPLAFRTVAPAIPTDLPAPDEAAARRLLGKQADQLFVLFPGRFTPDGRSHLTLLGALVELRARGAQTPDLICTGPGRVPEGVRRFADRHGLGETVRFRGPADRATEAALYRLAVATVLPGWPEPGVRHLLEAQQLGCPVLSADAPENRERYGRFGDAMVWFEADEPASAADALAEVVTDRAAVLARQRKASTPLLARTWDDAAREWLSLMRESAEVQSWVTDAVDWDQAKPWAVKPSEHHVPGDRLELFLFLQVPFLGGVWQAARDLLEDLVAVNNERGRLKLTLGLYAGHDVQASIRHLRPGLGLERLRLNPMTRREAERVLGPGVLPDDGTEGFCFLNGAVETALRADAWLALTDRFPRPLLPARPYGVVVYDMIQRHVPEGFNPTFFRWYERGMLPTLANAECVITTSPATRDDVVAEVGLDRARVRHVPLAHNPHRRFGALTLRPVDAVRGPFLLNPTNMALHKGGQVLVKAYARLRERLGSGAPALVLCGVDTEKFSASYTQGYVPPNCLAVRELVAKAGLVEGKDVHYLGYLEDAELLDLYQRCSAVVNAARFDNGCFNTIEAAYFGRPAVCTRYPAAEYLAERFGVPVHFYPVNDDAGLADALMAALAEPVRTGSEVERARAHLMSPEFGSRRYAERFYEVSVELAEKGRRQRMQRPLGGGRAAAPRPAVGPRANAA